MQHERRAATLLLIIGLMIMAGTQAGLYGGLRFAAVWLTPLMWTGYILAVDALIYMRKKRSWLITRRLEFMFLALASVAVWLLFEAYNLHLQNWIYRGVPTNPVLRDFAYFWSFATIMPAVFETADLLEALWPKHLRPNLAQIGRWTAGLPDFALLMTGAMMVFGPLLLPTAIARYLFGFVWIGFIPLIDPLNARSGHASLREDLIQAEGRRVAALLVAGLICGLLWETWNYQAFLSGGGHWIYTIPEALRPFGWHFGQMPLLGLLGFPPFALELQVFYTWIKSTLRIEGHLDAR